MHVTYLACPGGTVAKWMPRMTPRRDTEQLACAVPGQYPSDSDSSAAWNHSRKQPRSSRWTAGVNVQAPLMPIRSTRHSFFSSLSSTAGHYRECRAGPVAGPLADRPALGRNRARLCFTSTAKEREEAGSVAYSLAEQARSKR